MQRAVKVQCLLTGRYFQGATENVSVGGVLMQVSHPSLMVPGQRVRVGIASSPRHVILGQNDFHEGTVVRALGLDGQQNVAVEYDQPQELELAATG